MFKLKILIVHAGKKLLLTEWQLNTLFEIDLKSSSTSK